MNYGKIKGHLIRTSITGKMISGNYQYLVSVNIKKISNVLLHTSYGEMVVDHNFATIQINGSFGEFEFLAGNFGTANALARKIIREKIHHQDIAAFIETEIDIKVYDDIALEFVKFKSNKTDNSIPSKGIDQGKTVLQKN